MRHSFDTNPTIFGKILRNEIPCTKVYEDDYVLAFNDINPKAAVHILIIPKTHMEGIQDAQSGDEILLGRLLVAANHIAGQLNIRAQGFRIITNAGAGAGQEVPHLHLHLVSGPDLPSF